MNVDTRLTGTWRNRMLIVAAVIFGTAGWFLYDGLVAWPQEAARYVEFEKVARAELGHELEKHGDVPPEVKMAWERFAGERGWSPKVPKERTEADIRGQFLWAGGAGAIAVAFLLWVLWNQTLHIRADDKCVYSARGKAVPWEAFTGMDRRKWEKKGIAVALYEENGQEKRLILDDYKFGGTAPIILEIEKRLGIEYVGPKDEPEGDGAEPDAPDEAAKKD